MLNNNVNLINATSLVYIIEKAVDNSRKNLKKLRKSISYSLFRLEISLHYLRCHFVFSWLSTSYIKHHHPFFSKSDLNTVSPECPPLQRLNLTFRKFHFPHLLISSSPHLLISQSSLSVPISIPLILYQSYLLHPHITTHFSVPFLLKWYDWCTPDTNGYSDYEFELENRYLFKRLYQKQIQIIIQEISWYEISLIRLEMLVNSGYIREISYYNM